MENPSSLLVAIEELGDEESKSSDHDNGMEIREITSGSKDMGDAVAMSGVTFADGVSKNTPKADPSVAPTEGTEGRKINRHDVRNVFRGSNITGTVSQEQIIRIRSMHLKISNGVDW
mmetsp:Transcript_13222/g.24325  ORF Transcript_13222/g.24325 Transcript_13222/m.24325 type:complete len:117 (-) Transcript_13222:1225-1575(-)|eukprot:CAMPEP_0201946630 /NCGR_PEP_ID=MMETSP0903-20130614/54518_1 /ASSEMBLY_ACC=CAM_ASM_000552 /TAXON_ID=420261 /ORGANISM="Thalassiosira antarctica, Strain CCMP982" /LENGTH=116 /DNA_ID=CAMNT_0048489735 /DNA_START=105 /DNA_END=455 /DNA_ORIENTATION=+